MPPNVFFELRLRRDIGLGRDHPPLVPLPVPVVEKLPHWRRRTLDARRLFDHRWRGLDGDGRVLLEIFFQAGARGHQVTLRAAKVQLLQSLDPTGLILAPVAAQRIAADPGQAADLLVRQVLTLEINRFHLPLHARVRMMIPFVLQGVDFLLAKFYPNHLSASDRLSAGSTTASTAGRSETQFVPVGSISSGVESGGVVGATGEPNLVGIDRAVAGAAGRADRAGGR